MRHTASWCVSVVLLLYTVRFTISDSYLTIALSSLML
jgi:hypothetical protein